MAVDLMQTDRTYRHITSILSQIDGRDDLCPIKKNQEKLFVIQFHLHCLINNLPDSEVQKQCNHFYSTYVAPLHIPCGPEIPLVCGNCLGCDNTCCNNCSCGGGEG